MSELDLHTLTGAYALDALDDLELRQFRAHLAECDSCQQEVAGLAATAARLAGAVAEPAPPAMRARVLAQVSTTRQLPPGTGQREQQTQRAWYRQPLGIAASFLLVLALGLAGLAVNANRRADQAEQLADRITSVLSDPGRREAQQPVTSGGTSSLIAAGDQAVFTASGVPALPDDRTYQLWVINASGARSVGVLGRADNGRLTQFVPGVKATDTVGLSVEPAGGSKAPTTDPVVAIPASA